MRKLLQYSMLIYISVFQRSFFRPTVSKFYRTKQLLLHSKLNEQLLSKKQDSDIVLTVVGKFKRQISV